MIDRSTKLLIRLFVPRLQWAWLTGFVVMAAYGVCQPRETEGPFMALVAGVGCATLTLLHTRLHKMPFPVTNRQFAYLPIVAYAIGWLAATVGLLLGQMGALWFTHGNPFPLMADTLRPALAFLPWLGVLLLIFVRQLRNGTVFLLYIGFLPLIGGWDMSALSSLISFLWPVALALIVWLLYEAPAHAIGARQCTLTTNPYGTAMPDPWSGPEVFRSRTVPVTVVLLMCGSATALYLILLTLGLPVPGGGTSSPVYRAFMGLGIPLAGFAWGREMARQTRASGFSQGMTALLTPVRLLLVFEPFVTLIGIRRGTMVRCGQCRSSRFAWQRACPHCERAVEASHEPVVKVRRSLVPDVLTFVYRIYLPMTLLLIMIFRVAKR